MKRILALFVAVALPATAQAESLIAARMIRSQTILTAADLKVIADPIVGAASNPNNVLGLEARVNIYAGRPILARDLGEPAVVERNQLIILKYVYGSIEISADGRALGRAATGERIRVMNLDSRSTVTGTVQPDGTITVGPAIS